MSKTPISVCIIAKNEERYLKGCLETLLPYDFEIIVVDTGSTDKTVEIAKQFTQNVYFFEWIDDFSAAKNYAASNATNDWILALDCDESIKKIDVPQLISILPGKEKQIGSITLENLIRDGDAIGKSTQSVFRLYNKKHSLYEGLIHEQIRSLKGKPLSGFDTLIFATHYGYFITPEESQIKNERNISLLLKELSQNPKEPYYYFQLGQSYAVLNDYEKVFSYLQQGLDLNPDPNQDYTQQMLIDYGTAMLNTGRYELAMNMELLYDSLCQYSDYLFLLGRIFFANNYLIKAIETFVKATMAPKCIVFGTNSFFPLHSMALIYEKIGETELAKECNDQVEAILKNSGMENGAH